MITEIKGSDRTLEAKYDDFGLQDGQEQRKDREHRLC